MRKIAYFLLFAAGFTFLFAGCTPSQKKSSNKIVIWHWIKDREDAFEALGKKYTQETGVQVEFKLFTPPDIYAQKVIAAARARRLPDIFGILAEKKILASFIKAGYIADLSPYMNANDGAWKKSFYDSTLEVTAFTTDNTYNAPEGLYGVPIDTAVMQFVYNKDLLQQGDFGEDDFPSSFTAFLEYSKKLKNTLGVDGFTCGWSESWLLQALASEWAINLMGEKAFIDTIEGKIPYTDKRWVQIFTLFDTLRTSGILTSNITTMVNKEAENLFAHNKAAFSFDGTWAANIYKQLNPELNYGFFGLPLVSGHFPARIWGGAGSSFMVNEQTPQKEKAVAFLQWLTAKPQQEYLIRKTNNLPSIKGCEEALPDFLQPLVASLNSLTHPNTWPRNEDSRVLEVFGKGLQQIVMGIRTPQEIAEKVQQVKERAMKR